ncbi:MAG: undecaprenyldiphospho-muramoylpentapeptide beta-N-acetylglucosaminyltransferase [Myxococcota bacterium]
MMDVLIAGGGTGGHLFPGIALAQEVRRRDAQARVIFVGSRRGIEAHAVPKAGFEVEFLPISGLRRKGFTGAMKGLAQIPWAMGHALRVVHRFKPQVAVSVGGYAAGPAVLAAKLLGVPCVVMEQNAIGGVTNRILSRIARTVFASMPTQGFDARKVSVVGNPVRSDLLAVRSVPFQVGSPLHLLVFGGSQGARALNDVMLEIAPELVRGGRWQVTHQTGTADFERAKKAYALLDTDAINAVPFIDDMAAAYAQAHLVISRAGATTLAELTVCGRPAILVPYPFAVDDHQTKNALTLAQTGAAILVPQHELTATGLLKHLQGLADTPQRLVDIAQRAHAAGHPYAARDIVDALDEMVGTLVSEDTDHV